MSRAAGPVAYTTAGEPAQLHFAEQQRRWLADLYELGHRVIVAFAEQNDEVPR